MHHTIVVAVALTAGLAFAQETQETQEQPVVDAPAEEAPAPRVIFLPPPEEPQEEPEPPPQPLVVPLPDREPAPETRTLEAIVPEAPVREELDEQPQELQVPDGPGAMLDGHPREGAFLSGPGSGIFLAHHTLMLGLGGFATQLVPRLIHASSPHPVPGSNPVVMAGCDSTLTTADGVNVEPYASYPIADRPMSCGDIATGSAARIAYLTGGLVGAGVGFASAAIWQFFNWMSVRSATFGIINSAYGAMFLGAMADLIAQHNDAYATAWMSLLGGVGGGWLSVILARGDYPLNKMFLITSGGAWAALYGALIVGIVATTGGMSTPRTGLGAVMLMPALGAGVAALAALKLNPSIAQIMRANLFGALVGGVVLVVAGLALGPTTGFTQSPVPYILSGVGALGAQTLVSLLWADAADESSAAANNKALNWW